MAHHGAVTPDNELHGPIGELDPEQTDQLALCIGALDSFSETGRSGRDIDESPRDLAAVLVAAALDDGEVAAAFWWQSLECETPIAAIRNFAIDVARRAGASHSGPQWLLARCLDRLGDTAAAEDILAAIVTSSSTYGPALVDAAGLASDRGDAAMAYRWLRQAEVLDPSPDEERDWGDAGVAAMLVREVEGFALHRPAPQVGRNEPCPCGSGRKYKVCHLGREPHPLGSRSGWLYEKAARFLRSRHPDVVVDLADRMAIAAGSAELFDAVLDGPLMPDVALHEGGVFDEFLAARHDLLPDDEALLASQWSLVDRSVFEFLTATDDRIEIYDVARGETLTVVNVSPGSRPRPGSLMVGRPLPVGEVYRAFAGFMDIPRAALDGVLRAIERGDADSIVARLGEILRPPQLQNTDGHDLEWHTIRWHVPDARRADAGLRRAGLERDAETNVWQALRAEPDGSATVIATVERIGRELVGEVNSRERAEALRAAIASALPTAEVVDDTVTRIDDELARQRREGAPPAAELDDPDVAAMLAEHIADYERRWLDESIPALGGRTPRQSAADPVGREELLQLLDSFPAVDSADLTMMSAERIRAALGM
jgi:hypothetical protein